MGIEKRIRTDQTGRGSERYRPQLLPKHAGFRSDCGGNYAVYKYRTGVLDSGPRRIALVPEEALTPWVQVAAFCQTVLAESNALLSLIRLIDRQTVVGATPEMQPTTVNLTLVVVLKSGNMVGHYKLTIQPNTPSQTPLPPVHVPVLFEGLERGVGLVTQIGLVVNEQGLWWFDVLIEQTLLTRIPLRILYQQVQQITPGPSAAT